MELLQQILAYSILMVAVGYLVWRFLLPKPVTGSKKEDTKACGQNDCGCR